MPDQSAIVQVAPSPSSGDRPSFNDPPPIPREAEDASQYINYLFYQRTGELCYAQALGESFGYPDGYFDALAEDLEGESGSLSDRNSYVGSIEATLRAWTLESVGLEFETIAFGLGRVQPDRAPYGPPTGTWWSPEFVPFELADGRAGWTFTGQHYYAPDDCPD